MTTKNILHTIKSNMSGFSKGQKRIGSYILENYDKAAFMTASKLGGLVGVSESTVVRFAAELGYDGYPSMQRALQELEREGMVYTQRTSGRFVTEDTKVIESAKKLLAEREIKSFLAQMGRLGYPKEEIVSLLEASIEEEKNNGDMGM